METTEALVGGSRVRIRTLGAATAPTVVVLLGAHPARDPARTDAALAARLEASGLRCVLVESDPALPVDQLPALLDTAEVAWAHLVGIGAGAPTAWAAGGRMLDRISSLVVLDPLIGGPKGPDPDTAPVEVATTVVALDPRARAWAYTAGRRVYADYRVVELGAGPIDLAAALATEVVLRSGAW